MYNKAILIGRLTADPELRTNAKGVNVCTFRIAVNRPHSKGGERKSDFITVVAWRQSAEFVCSYFGKGKAIGVEGAIQTGDYTDKNGNRRYTFEVAADRVFFVGDKEGGKAESDAEPLEDGFTAIDIDGDEDTPF